MRKFLIYLLCVGMIVGIMGCAVPNLQGTTEGSDTQATTETAAATQPSHTSEATQPTEEEKPGKTVAVSFQTETEKMLAGDGTVIFTNDVPSMNLYLQDNGNGSAIVKDFENLAEGRKITDLCDSLMSRANEQYQPGTDWRPYCVSQSYQATRLDERVLSVFGYVYSNAGGPHPSHYLNSATYDLETGKRITLSDILKDESCLESLAERVLDTLSNRGEDSMLFDDYVSVVMDHFTPGSPNFDSWYFSDQGLVIYFSVYEISSYAAGDFVMEYTYGDLQDILLPEYVPDGGVSADGALSAKLVDGRIPQDMPVVAALFLSNDGPKVFISAEGEIRNVTVESGSWTADRSMFLVDQFLLATNRISEGNGILIQSILPESAPNLRISYETKDGLFSRYLALDYTDGTVKLLYGAE